MSLISVAQKVARDKRSVSDAAVHRARLGHSIGTQLERAALSCDDADALATADMIKASARPENIFHAEDLHNADGVLFDGYGSLNFCSTRLDPAYMALSSRRARKRARVALDRCRPQSGEKLRLLTLTMPVLSDLSFGQVISLLDAALVLLKKRQWFKTQVRGAIIGVEFTLGQESDHWHVHAHMLAWSKWVKWIELREQWTACLRSAAGRLGLDFNMLTRDGLAVVDVRLVTAKRRTGRGTVGIDDAIQETCKYIVKGSQFEKLDARQLLEVERVLRGRPMIETFGECNAQRGKAAAEQDTYLDTQNTTDGSLNIQVISENEVISFEDEKKERGESLREVGARMIRAGRRELWLEMLDYILERRRKWRMTQLAKTFPFATFRTLDGKVWHGTAVNPS